MSYQMIIHGGANNLLVEETDRMRRCREIVTRVEPELRAGMGALDACERAVSLLEDDPAFNAGTGSYLQLDGRVRMDACIMDSDLRLGSVVQISDVRNPIAVARRLLETPLHSMLSGEGALAFAREQGFPLYDPATVKQKEAYRANKERLAGATTYAAVVETFAGVKTAKLGTVGCVVRDAKGRIAAGTSTGGLRACFPWRVGDTPLVGCGTYVNAAGGVSCTGVGEKIMRLTLARLVVFLMEQGMTVQKACEEGVRRMGKIEGECGVIAIGADSSIGSAFNTQTMSSARAEG